MAGLTTASLVGLYDPDEGEDRPTISPPTPTRRGSRVTRYLGLDASVRPLNAFALASSSFLSIAFLVFLNASQPFLLDLLGVPRSRVGRVTGNLLLADELVALCCYFGWGALADRIGVRWIAVSGHALCGLALFAYVNTPLSALIIARMFFAVGASALVTALSAALSTMTAMPSAHESTHNLSGPSTSEQTPLIGHGEDLSIGSEPRNSARFAGLLGFSTGLGALLAVFVLLPLPTQISAHFTSISLRSALRYTYYITACLALMESMFLIVGLKRPSSNALGQQLSPTYQDEPRPSLTTQLTSALKDLPTGFVIAKQEPQIALGYLASFTSRANATIVTGFIPLLINHYFRSHDLCSTPSFSPSLPAPEGCRPAYIFSSILTGVVQLVSLLSSPLIGQLASSYSPSLVLAMTSLFGAVAFLGWALLTDPRGFLPILFGVLAGVAQIGGIVVSLSLVAKARGQIVKKEGREVAGVVAAAYSVSGGLGILTVGSSAGWVFDAWTGAPFAIVAGVNTITCLAAIVVWNGERRKRRRAAD